MKGLLLTLTEPPLATPRARRIDALTRDCEWTLASYLAYEPLPSDANSAQPGAKP